MEFSDPPKRKEKEKTKIPNIEGVLALKSVMRVFFALQCAGLQI